VMVVQKHPIWENVGQSPRRETLGEDVATVRETRLRSAAQRLLIWDWYRINGSDTINPYVGKALFARDRLLGRGDDGAAVIIAAPYQASQADAEETLRSFVRDMLPSIRTTLAHAGAGTLASAAAPAQR
jgi:EpsI family protein